MHPAAAALTASAAHGHQRDNDYVTLVTPLQKVEMVPFTFETVPRLLIEYGGARQLGQILRDRYDDSRLCVITDQHLAASVMLEPILSSLQAAGWQTTVIDNVVSDPPEDIVKAAAERARAVRAEVIVGFGGGSSMDVAKLVAALLGSQQPLERMYGVGNVAGRRLPLVQVPTTAGTGSEVTQISIITTGATTKAGVVSPQLYADLAVIDAELTTGMPPSVTAATGIDAMVHAIEAYTTRHRKNPLSDMTAREALRLLAGNLLAACQDGTNREAREAMALGATLAGQAFANAPVGAVHALAYPLGGLFHVPHGVANAIMLPYVMRFNSPAACGLYAQLADMLLPGLGGDTDSKSAALVSALESLAMATGVPRTLREVNVTESDLPMLASEAMKQTRLLTNNPREMTLADALAIYTAAL